MAYALLAQLPPAYGLYTSFTGAVLYWLFGTSKDIVIGVGEDYFRYSDPELTLLCRPLQLAHCLLAKLLLMLRVSRLANTKLSKLPMP